MRLVSLALFVLAAAASAQTGTLDPAFGTGGIVLDSLSGQDDGHGLVIQPDGDLLVVGSSRNGTPQSQSARTAVYDASGVRLVTVVHDFLSASCPPGQPEAFYDVVPDSDSTFIVSGFTQTDCSGPQRDFWVHRLDESASRIATFDRPAFGGSTEYGWGLTRLPDGRVVVVGSALDAASTYAVAFTRFTPEGEVDLTFGTMGETVLDAQSAFDRPHRVAVAPDGGLVAAGFVYDGTQTDVLLVRLTEDGLPDPAFGTGGLVTLDHHGGDDLARDLVIQPGGEILVASAFVDAGGVSRAMVARFLPDGTPDSAFGTDGRIALDFNGLPAYGYALVVQTDGKIVVAGGTETGAGGAETQEVAIARLLPDGTLDPSFGTGGMQIAGWGPGPDFVRDLAIAPDGDLVVLGMHWKTDDDQDIAFARFIGDTPPVANEEAPPSPLALAVAPNPASGAVRVRYALGSPEAVHLALYDALGRKVAVLARGPQSAGEHEAEIDTSGLPAGAYLVRMAASGFQLTRHVTLLR